MVSLKQGVTYLLLSLLIATATVLYLEHNQIEAQLNIKLRNPQLLHKTSQKSMESGQLEHHCIHDEIIRQQKELYASLYKEHQDIKFKEASEWPEELNQQLEKEKIKLHGQGNWNPIRIYADYSNISPFENRFVNLIQHSVMPSALAFFSSVIKVAPLKKLEIDELYYQNTCGSVKVKIPPSDIKHGLYSFDTVFYVTAVDQPNDNYIAFSSDCPQFKKKLDNNRPTVGYIAFNKPQFDAAVGGTEKWFRFIEVAIHELTHSLGFSASLFSYFADQNKVMKLPGRDFVTFAPVVQLARTYFNCPAINGVPLENNNNATYPDSHWERTTFGNEIMTMIPMEVSVFSSFTADLLSSSGWYLFDDSQIMQLTWGKGQGCDILMGKCGSPKEEFCPTQAKNSTGCSFDYSSYGRCISNDTLTQGCSYWAKFDTFSDCNNPKQGDVWAKGGGAIGKDSRCWVTNIFQTPGKNDTALGGCFTSQCVNGVPEVFVNGVWHSCAGRANGQLIPVKGGGTVTCPNPDRFCNSMSACPNSCSNRGICSAGKCICFQGYVGDDCSV